MAPRCNVCKSERISAVTDTGEVPVFCNQLCKTKADAIGAPKAVIRLGFCESCGHVYNSLFDASQLSYSPEYENSLHFSEHFQRYAEELARDLTMRYGLTGKRIVEIGCGRGDFLASLCHGGRNLGLGFDMSYPPDEPPVSKSISVQTEPYGRAQGELNPDLVCMRHVLEHVAEPTDFLRDVRSTMRDGVPIYVEVPNVLYTLRDGGVWDLVYEHCSYFSTSSLQSVLQLSGFEVTQVREAFSGQFLCAHARAGQSTEEARPLPEMESLVLAFSSEHALKLKQWRTALEELALLEKRVVSWGAGSKGNTFSNLVAGGDVVPYVVDLNPRKHGMFVAGTGARIVPPEFVSEYRPDVVVVMNPAYESEIRARLSALSVSPQIMVA
jgi:hypothetical protein